MIETEWGAAARGHAGEHPDFVKASVHPAEDAEQDDGLGEVKGLACFVDVVIDPMLRVEARRQQMELIEREKRGGEAKEKLQRTLALRLWYIAGVLLLSSSLFQYVSLSELKAFFADTV